MKQNARKLRSDIASIDEALSVLDQAARDSGEEIRDLMKSEYRSLRGVLEEVTPQIGEAFRSAGETTMTAVRDAKDKAVESTKESAKAIDESAHDNPWAFIGGAAVTGGIIGYLLSRRNQGNSSWESNKRSQR